MHKLIRRVNQTGSQRPGADRQMERKGRGNSRSLNSKTGVKEKKELLYGEEPSCVSRGVEGTFVICAFHCPQNKKLDLFNISIVSS